MSALILVVLATSGALIIGAVWGLWAEISGRTEGLVVSAAGGALIVAITAELIEPADSVANILTVCAMVILGAATFTVIDWLVDEVWGAHHGGGFLAAVTLDGIPENLALGVALVHASPREIGAFIAALILSNLPEAAGGARRMHMSGRMSRLQALGIWSLTAVILAGSAVLGNLLLIDSTPHTLALFQSFAAGAVAASLATEIFPRAFKGADQWVGITTTLGVIAAYLLHRLGAE